MNIENSIKLLPLIICVGWFAGCNVNSNTLKPATVQASAQTSNDEKVIQAIQNWCKEHGGTPPPSSQIVVVKRTSETYEVRVGPDLCGATVCIDAKTMKITRVIPGY